MSNIAKNRVKSSWTPLNNEEVNQKWKQQPTAKIFEERRALVSQWFGKWTDGQRKIVLEELLDKCKLRQIQFAGDIVNKKRPVQHEDFTRSLPRVLSLYIFSFLDPRSLCRCSQVCWYWKYLSELDQLWVTKCMRLGWILPFNPSPYEAGVWKRLYIENTMALKCLTPKVAKVPKPVETETALTARSDRPDSRNSRSTPRKSNRDGRPPWRGSDPVPKDIWRNNILDNDDEDIEKMNKLRRKGVFGKEVAEVSRRATPNINTNRNPAKRPSSIPRSKSVPGLGDSFGNSQRPEWAKNATIGTPYTSENGENTQTLNDSIADASKRPSPVKTVKIVAKPHRTPRDPPSSNLFPEQPWNVPDGDDYDSEVY